MDEEMVTKLEAEIAAREAEIAPRAPAPEGGVAAGGLSAAGREEEERAAALLLSRGYQVALPGEKRDRAAAAVTAGKAGRGRGGQGREGRGQGRGQGHGQGRGRGRALPPEGHSPLPSSSAPSPEEAAVVAAAEEAARAEADAEGQERARFGFVGGYDEERGYDVCGIFGCILSAGHAGPCVREEVAGRRRKRRAEAEAAAQPVHRVPKASRKAHGVAAGGAGSGSARGGTARPAARQAADAAGWSAEDALRRQQARPTPSRCSDDEAEAVEATACATCGSTEDEPGSNDILLCDACDAGYHMRCLQPPLEAVPEGDWFCAQCAAARGGSPACAAGVRMPAGWESVPLLWSIAFVWPKGAPFTETLSGQSGGRGALNAP